MWEMGGSVRHCSAQWSGGSTWRGPRASSPPGQEGGWGPVHTRGQARGCGSPALTSQPGHQTALWAHWRSSFRALRSCWTGGCLSRDAGRASPLLCAPGSPGSLQWCHHPALPFFLYPTSFLFVIEHMMPLCMVISWVYSVAMMIQHIVTEKEHRLKEVGMVGEVPREELASLSSESCTPCPWPPSPCLWGK